MRRRLAVLVLVAATTHSTPAGAQGTCDFVLGFRTLRDLVGAPMVGSCLENQRFEASGNAEQRTAGGLLVWRKADNWTAFTDGYRTWLNGPNGLQQRLNTERFRWEGDAGAPGTTLVAEAPSSPTLVAPSDRASVGVLGRPTLRWSGGGPEYQLQLEAVSGSLWAAGPEGWIAAMSWQIPELGPGEYRWRVRSRRESAVSDWSPYWRFVVQGPAERFR